jgi:hypothetical protein
MQIRTSKVIINHIPQLATDSIDDGSTPLQVNVCCGSAGPLTTTVGIKHVLPQPSLTANHSFEFVRSPTSG